MTAHQTRESAPITGVTGQERSLLAESLHSKGYEVHGIKRCASSFNTQLIDHIFEKPQTDLARFTLHYGDLTETSNLTRIYRSVEPDEIYSLGAQSHVAVSFQTPECTVDVDANGLFVGNHNCPIPEVISALANLKLL